MSSDGKSGPNLTQAAYVNLRADILACRHMPSERLNISELCKKLNVSPGAVREALARLTSDCLVVAEPQKGFSVSPVSVDDLVKLTRARIELERISVRSSIENGNMDWEADVVGAHYRLSRTPYLCADGVFVTESWSINHVKFHEAIVSACDNPWLLRVRETLFVQAERYRRLAHDYDPHRAIDREHEAIAEAVLARNVDDSLKLLTQHFEMTMASLIPRMRNMKLN